jgi:DNA-directed RNA polymerase specialized sigma24 family protein
VGESRPFLRRGRGDTSNLGRERPGANAGSATAAGSAASDLDQVAPNGDSDDAAGDLLALHEALDQLAAEELVAAEVVKLRYFAGLTAEQAALALNISLRTANRDWAFARAWLYRRLNPDGDASV